MKRFGILFHPKRPGAFKLAEKITELLHSLGCTVWVRSSWEEQEARTRLPETDVVISLGGDGTILRISRIIGDFGVPILGVNLGKLGFMTELTPKNALEKLPVIVSGQGWVEERMMLQAEVVHPEGTHRARSRSYDQENKGNQVFHALNDIVLSRGAFSRMVYLRVELDGDLLTTYAADGVIVASPTGSTGYSLAAGGPIMHPALSSLLLLPIAPHLSLGHPLILPPTSTINLQIRADHQATLSIDGQVDVYLETGSIVKVTRSPQITRFLRLQEHTYFYRTLMERLRRRGTVC